MLKTLFTSILLVYASNLFSQIGIGTTTPNATLDIRSSSLTAPTNTDGLLIPKINVFPAINPTAQQQSMLVYLTTTVGTNPPGFYYWNYPTSSWLPFISTASATSYWDRDASGFLFPETIADRVEIPNTGVATGVPNTGALEIANLLRMDRFGLTTNTNNTLYMQYENNGDFSVDSNTLYVDASANNVGIGTASPDARLNIYNTAGTSHNLHIEKTNGTADAVLIENAGTGTALRAENNGSSDTAEFFNYGNARGLYVQKDAGSAEAARIYNGGSGPGLYLYNNSPQSGLVSYNHGTGHGAYIYKSNVTGNGIRVVSTSSEAALEAVATVDSPYAHGIRASAGGQYCNLISASAGGWAINVPGASGLNAAAVNIGVEGRASNLNLTTTDKMGGLFYVSSSTTNAVPAVAAVGSIVDNTTYKILGFGIVSTLIRDSENIERVMVAPEAPEALFQDYGIGTLVNGYAKIELDPLLSNNIAVDVRHPMKVFIQLEGDCNGVYVTNKSAKSFEVQELGNGRSNVSFSYQIIANRADEERGGHISEYADMRFKPLTKRFVVDTKKSTSKPLEINLEGHPTAEKKPIRKERTDKPNERYNRAVDNK